MIAHAQTAPLSPSAAAGEEKPGRQPCGTLVSSPAAAAAAAARQGAPADADDMLNKRGLPIGSVAARLANRAAIRLLLRNCIEYASPPTQLRRCVAFLPNSKMICEREKSQPVYFASDLRTRCVLKAKGWVLVHNCVALALLF
jgi:hypothetical protein